jgi:hypothetical protein
MTGTNLRVFFRECCDQFSEEKCVKVLEEAYKVFHDGRKVHSTFVDLWKVVFPGASLEDRKALYARIIERANIPVKNYGKSVTKESVVSRLDARLAKVGG